MALGLTLHAELPRHLGTASHGQADSRGLGCGSQLFDLISDGLKKMSDKELADQKKKVNGIFELKVSTPPLPRMGSALSLCWPSCPPS